MRKIIVKLTPDGLIQVEAEGYTGTSCEEATKFLQQLGSVAGVEKKPEYYEEPQREVEYDG